MLDVQVNLLLFIHGSIEWLDTTLLHFALTYIHPPHQPLLTPHLMKGHSRVQSPTVVVF
jgi:hypothetical protein